MGLVFYGLFYGTLRLGVAVLGVLFYRPDNDASFFDGEGKWRPMMASESRKDR